MNFLSATGLSKSYGPRLLFEGLDLHIQKGDKIGLIARNGSGKTTLLKILSGAETADQGQVLLQDGINKSFLSQESDFDLDQTAFDAVFSTPIPVLQTLKRYWASQEHPLVEEQTKKLWDEMDRLDAWSADARVREILTLLHLDHLSQPIRQMSGGQQKRVALARVLVATPDFCIMDEPTNHLDLDMIEWLEEWLMRSSMTFLMVSHDRYFLDRVCNQIWELDQQKLYRHRGSYAYYLEKKQERLENQAAYQQKMRNLFQRELQWVRRQPQARSTKPKARLEEFQQIRNELQKRRLDEKPEFIIQIPRTGGKILELHHITKSWGEQVLVDDFSYKFKEGERIGIVGPNGSGKSTLLKMIMGAIPPDKGKIVVGETIRFGYFGQDGIVAAPEMRMLEYIQQTAHFLPLVGGTVITAAQLLEKFLFPREMHYQTIGTLSGGEKRRLYLLTVLMQNPNFLILDEPTNDLDVLTLQVLEDFLEGFPACVLVVSHDRFLLDRISDHLWIWEGKGRIRDFNGHYSAWRATVALEYEQAHKPLDTSAPKEIKKVATQNAVGLSWKEKKELEHLEKRIEELEARRDVLANSMSRSDAADHERIFWGNEMAVLIQELEQSNDRWLNLMLKQEES